MKITGGKKIRAARQKVVENAQSLRDALNTLKEVSFAKFDPTVEVVLKLGVDPKRSDQVVRGIVNMPAGKGGKLARVAVICKEDKVEMALAAGADIVGSVDVIDEIKSGKINFDVCIATPDMMGSVGQVAKILGPKGLMPNPKLGTVTQDIVTAIKNAKSGQVEFRVEKAGIVHAGVGKLSFTNDALVSNIVALFDAVTKAKPAASKGTYMKAMFLSCTMAPSVKVDIATVVS